MWNGSSIYLKISFLMKEKQYYIFGFIKTVLSVNTILVLTIYLSYWRQVDERTFFMKHPVCENLCLWVIACDCRSRRIKVKRRNKWVQISPPCCRFFVLNNLMMNHWGLQKRETRPKWRQMQHFLNNRFGSVTKCLVLKCLVAKCLVASPKMPRFDNA